MRRFELVECTSSKFWEVELVECDVTVRFGRIGTSGQTKTKTFVSAAAAQKEHDTLVKEKTGKGYVDVGAAAGAKLAAASAPAAPATPPASVKPPTPTASPAPAAPAARAATVAPAITVATDVMAWPEGGFQWTDELRRALPIVRGIHAPPPIDGKALLAKPIAFIDDNHGYHATFLSELTTAAGRNWVYWGAQGSADHIQHQHLARADHEFWLELCAQAAVARLREQPGNEFSYYSRYGLQWATEACSRRERPCCGTGRSENRSRRSCAARDALPRPTKGL